jgi:hypothetical protein
VGGAKLRQPGLDAPAMLGDPPAGVGRVGVRDDAPDLVERDLELAQDADVAGDLDLVAAVEPIAVAVPTAAGRSTASAS